MTLFVRRCILILAASWAFSGRVSAQHGLMDYQNSLRFARYLVNTRQYDFAAQEYERLNFLWPGDSAVVLELVTTYRNNHNCGQFYNAFSLLSENNRLFEFPSYSGEFLRFCLDCRIHHPAYFDFVSKMEPDRKAFYSLAYYWMREQPDSAVYLMASDPAMEEIAYLPLVSLTGDYRDQKYKKPVLAMAMSTVLPGSGKAYAKHWADATVSFLFISTTAYASYRAFRKKGIKSVNGWLFGGISFSFYSSNIYGSFKATRRYNEAIRKNYQENAEAIVYRNY